MPVILRPYQNDLVQKVREAYENGYKAPCIVLGCGGGKSVIVGDMAAKTTAKGNRVLFLVHRKELCEQIERTFNMCGVDMSLCQIGMVQTITRRLNKTPEPKLIITDENHHSLAKTYKKIYEYFPNARRIGVTATPVRLNGSGLADVNDKLIVGVSTKWLIENNYLAPYDYYSPSVADLSGLHIRVGEYIQSEVENVLIKKQIFGDVISYYRKLAGNRQAICYCAGISHSKAMTGEFNAAGISADHIDGDTPAPDRADIVERFRNGTVTILCNVDLISEGFDVPDCECSILLRPTQSLTLYIQQSMRCMRYKQDKRAVIIDHVGNYARFGLPDAEREWKLDTNPHKREKGENAVAVRQCPECYFTHEPAEKCPKCGYIYPVKSRELEVDKTAELNKITEQIVINYTTPGECTTVAELYEYARTHNYKKGWAWYQAKARGML